MRPSTTGATVVVALTAAVAWGSAPSVSIGSASHLAVDAGLVQTWLLPGPEAAPPQPQPPEVDLSACGDLDQYDGITYGTDGPDEIDGGNRPQILVGLGGADVLRGGNQHDCLLGGDGDDVLLGGNGKDVLVGGAGRDTLDGGNGKDALYGDDGGAACSSAGDDVFVDECSSATPVEQAHSPPARPGQPSPDASPDASPKASQEGPQPVGPQDSGAAPGPSPASPRSDASAGAVTEDSTESSTESSTGD